MKKTVAFLMCLSAAGLLAGCGAKTEATKAAGRNPRRRAR